MRHTMLRCFTIGRQPHRIVFLNGTGVGALPNKLPEERVACAFVNLYEGALCVSNGHRLPFFCRRLPWCAMGDGNLAGWLIPRALHCLVECGVFGWRIRSAGANTPPVFNVRAYRTREAGAPSSRRPSAAEGALPRERRPVCHSLANAFRKRNAPPATHGS